MEKITVIFISAFNQEKINHIQARSAVAAPGDMLTIATEVA
jgi:hypothetical protein